MSMWRRRIASVFAHWLALGLVVTVGVAVVPPLLATIDRAARQRETIDDMRKVGTAIFEFITDEAGAAAAGASVFSNVDDDWWDPLDYEDGRLSAEELEELLALEPDPYKGVIRYIQFVPERDGWGRSYHYFLKQENLLSAQVTAIFSCGEPTRSGDCKSPVRTPKGKFLAECYSSDLVWADGTFIHYPTTAPEDGDLLRPRTCDHGAG